MQYVEYSFTSETLTSDVIIALISDIPFEAFEETSNGCFAYIQESLYTEEVVNEIVSILENFDLQHTISYPEPVNWNAAWESNFDPIIIPNICSIRAEFHNIEVETPYEIVIAPKMSFGTGHHATTYMMIQMMNQINLLSKKVFDYGCGTGILSIFAEKKGADFIYGIDIEDTAIENSIEHRLLNECSKSEFELGDISLLSNDVKYDIILANINKNVILSSLEKFHSILADQGSLLVSGILSKDLGDLQRHQNFKNFVIRDKFEKDNWLCLHLTK